MKRITLIGLSLALILSCKTKKQNGKTPVADVPVIQLDTISISSKEPVENKVYRASVIRNSDILHTRLEVSFDWQKSQMPGKATIDLKQHFYPSDKLYLNARGMEIKSIQVSELKKTVSKDKSGKEITSLTPTQLSGHTFKYENDSITITLPRVFTAAELLRLEITYIAKPNELKIGGSAAINSDKGLYFINPTGENPHKMPQIWTQGETESNSAWFPTNDNPSEKMTQEILMTVDSKYTTLSNGTMINSTTNADGTRTDHWKLDDPHAPYLAMMAVGQFQKVVHEPWRGKEISYYVEKEYEPHAKAIFGDTKEMIEFYSNRLGVPYAWPKYAQIAVRDYVSGAMENTSATLHGDFAVYQTTREMIDGKKGTDIIAHELFHQWFGDLVTCESWSNLPLNESFATYGEYLWEEYKNGRDAADHHHAGSRSGYLFSSKEVNLIRFDYEDREDMFDGFSYAKGGQILHMLRKAVGDDAFFASLKNYLETNKFKTAEIHHLRLAFEEVTGKDMNWFFNEWFLNKGRPKLNVKKQYNKANAQVELTVEQNQDLSTTPLYTLPIDVDVYVDGKMMRTRIWVNRQKQNFSIPCSTEPSLVNFDAERQLLCDMDYTKTKEEYLFQYKNAPLYEDRHEALTKMEKELNDNAVFEMFKWAAAKDPFAPLRNYALQKLGEAPADKMNEVKAIWKEIYLNDKKSTTRAKALELLNKKFADDPDLNQMNDKAFSEASYAINAVAFDRLIARDNKQAMEKAKQLESETGKSLLFSIAGLYSEYGADDQISFFNNSMRYINGFELISFLNDYIKTAKRCVKAESALMAATDFEWVARGGGRFTKFGSVKGIRDLISIWESKEKAQLAKIETAKKESKDSSALEKELTEIASTKESLKKAYDRAK